MKSRNTMTFILAVIVSAMFCLTGCSGDSSKQINEVYEDMKAAFEQSGLIAANIGLFSKTEKDGAVSFGECGSGVIFRKNDQTYYALTAAHVVSVKDAQILVFTVNTEMKTDYIPGMENLNAPTLDTYNAMYPAEVLYVSSRDDLAVISFSADEDLPVMEFAASDPNEGDRIMCVGNPQNNWFAVSYGTVTSGIEQFGTFKGFPSNAMKHTAYIQVGSSGGAAIDEQMKLAGITPGAALSLDGKTFLYGVLIPASEINLCLNEWNSQQAASDVK